jgi:hypothetical protein
VSKERYDLIDDLGPKNWLDMVAGEAVLLGWFYSDVELTMKGTMLAESISKVRFDNDLFCVVEAQAKELVGILEKYKESHSSVLFLDEICEYDGKSKSLNKWEYSLMLCEGRYQILMLMPEYFGSEPPDSGKSKAEEIIMESYDKPTFADLTMVEDSKMMGRQKMDTTDYYTNDDKLICHKVDFDHDCGWKRGQNIIYYIDDYTQAITVWTRIKTTLNQKR